MTILSVWQEKDPNRISTWAEGLEFPEAAGERGTVR